MAITLDFITETSYNLDSQGRRTRGGCGCFKGSTPTLFLQFFRSFAQTPYSSRSSVSLLQSSQPPLRNAWSMLFCCARIYSALRRSSAGLSPVFTKAIFFFYCLTYTYKQDLHCICYLKCQAKQVGYEILGGLLFCNSTSVILI